MELALVFTFLSLALTSLSDLVPKISMGKVKSHGGYICIVGVIETFCMMWLSQGLGSNTRHSLFLCVMAGLSSVVANIFLIESMHYQSASLSSIIYRLNMVFVFIGSFLFLGEAVTKWQWLGILIAVMSVCIFTTFKRGDRSSSLGLILALLASVLRTAMGLFYKEACNNGVSPNTLALVTGISWIVCGFAYSLLRDKKKLEWTTHALTYRYSIIAGILVTGIVYCMAHSVSLGKASIMLPIAQMSFVPTFFLEATFMSEKITTRKIIGLIGCVCAIFLLILGGK